MPRSYQSPSVSTENKKATGGKHCHRSPDYFYHIFINVMSIYVNQSYTAGHPIGKIAFDSGCFTQSPRLLHLQTP